MLPPEKSVSHFTGKGSRNRHAPLSAAHDMTGIVTKPHRPKSSEPHRTVTSTSVPSSASFLRNEATLHGLLAGPAERPPIEMDNTLIAPRKMMKRPSWLVALRVEGKYIGLDAGKDITKRRHPQHQVDRPLQLFRERSPAFAAGARMPTQWNAATGRRQERPAGRRTAQAHSYWDSHGCRAIASTPPGKRSRPRG